MENYLIIKLYLSWHNSSSLYCSAAFYFILFFWLYSTLYLSFGVCVVSMHTLHAISFLMGTGYSSLNSSVLPEPAICERLELETS